MSSSIPDNYKILNISLEEYIMEALKKPLFT